MPSHKPDNAQNAGIGHGRGRNASQYTNEARAYGESELVHRGQDGTTVATPLTHFAAQWWSRGTEWPLAQMGSIDFDRYYASGPSFILVLPNGRRFLLHIGDPNFSLVNEKNKMAYRELRGLTSSQGAEFIEKFAFVMADFYLRREIPKVRFKEGREIPTNFKNLLTKRSALEIVSRSGLSLFDIPKSLVDEEVCLAAVQHRGMALQHVPVHMRNFEICQAAIRQKGEALQFVPSYVRTGEMINEAVE